MTQPGFGSTLSFASDGGLELAVSPDRQAFTITCSDFQVGVEAGGAAPVATRVVSVVIPLDGLAHGTEVSFAISGFAFVTDGAAGVTMIVANGTAGVDLFSSGADNDFVHQLTIDGSGASECHLSVFLVAERDSGNPDATARLNVLSIDAEITRPAGAADTPSR